MKRSQVSVIAATASVFALTALMPLAGLADNTQTQKNNWRNLGIGAGAIAAHGLLRGNGLETVVGVAGAAYSANRYEQERKKQAASQRARARYHRRGHSNREYYTYNGHQYYRNMTSGERYRVS